MRGHLSLLLFDTPFPGDGHLVVAGVKKAGWTEQGAEHADYRLVLDGRRVDPTPENLERYLQRLLKRLQVSWLKTAG